MFLNPYFDSLFPNLVVSITKALHFLTVFRFFIFVCLSIANICFMIYHHLKISNSLKKKKRTFSFLFSLMLCRIPFPLKFNKSFPKTSFPLKPLAQSAFLFLIGIIEIATNTSPLPHKPSFSFFKLHWDRDLFYNIHFCHRQVD